MRIVLGIVAMVIGACTATLIAGSASWNRATGAAVEQLAASSPGPALDAAKQDQLPPPVLRYFRKVLPGRQPMIRSAIATQDAEFFINGAWRPLRATQHFRTSPPAFVWDARIEMAPLMTAFVRDSYVDGRGGMRAAMFGVLTLADQSDKRELNLGALQRFLGEAIWMPTALLPSDRVTWTPRDDRSALATLADGPNSVTLLFEFGEDGMVKSLSGDRFKEASGAYSLQTWQIQCDEPRERDGFLIPMRCEVAWITNGVREPYWRGRITSMTYDYDSLK
jgi:hypothetical protein